MTDFNPEDPEQLALYNEAMQAVEHAWHAYLRFTRCVGCAEQEITSVIKSSAEAAKSEIIGIDFLNEWAERGGSDDEWPMERNGIQRECKDCRIQLPG
jgi:hypothetical protein